MLAHLIIDLNVSDHVLKNKQQNNDNTQKRK